MNFFILPEMFLGPWNNRLDFEGDPDSDPAETRSRRFAEVFS